MTILAADSVPAARETSRTPAMADKPPATTAHVASVRLVQWRESVNHRVPLRSARAGLVDRPGQTALAAVIVTSCMREAPLPESIPVIAASSARSASIQLAQRRPRPVSLDQSLGVFAGLIG